MTMCDVMCGHSAHMGEGAESQGAHNHVSGDVPQKNSWQRAGSVVTVQLQCGMTQHPEAMSAEAGEPHSMHRGGCWMSVA